MKFLILNYYDDPGLEYIYAHNPGLETRSYQEQLRAHTTDFFYFTADFYSSNLRKLGHEAYDIIGNSEILQNTWAEENGLKTVGEPRPMKTFRSRLHKMRDVIAQSPLQAILPKIKPFCRSLFPEDRFPAECDAWRHKIIGEQIKQIQPDVLINVAMGFTPSSLLAEIRPYVKLLVGQFAWPLPEDMTYGHYDLFLSSLPNFVEKCRRQGIHSQLLKLAFEPRILPQLQSGPKSIPISFIGSISSNHQKGANILEHLCREFPVKVFGYGVENLSPDSPIRNCWEGPVWGIEAYQTLKNSKIVFNRHGDFAGNFANNLRLYEVTGVGSLLLTDWKVNLPELFIPGEEAITYRTPEECLEHMKYFLEHDEQRETIAHAGQTRTLNEHSYFHRMQELVDIVSKCL